MQNFIDFADKTVLITGASSGIGAATAELFATLGARVLFTYNKNREGAEALAARIPGSQAVHADFSTAVGTRTFAQSVEADILVNNAGSLVKRMPLLDFEESLWDEVFNLNLKSALICSQILGTRMAARGKGSIVNIVSIAGRNGGGPGAGAYATAKGALITLTKGLARELAPKGVRVNAVSPGVIDTPFHEVFSTKEMMENFVRSIPLGRTGTSAEVASAIAFLASDAASYITGETLEVNGGQLML